MSFLTFLVLTWDPTRDGKFGGEVGGSSACMPHPLAQDITKEINKLWFPVPPLIGEILTGL
jgi:hypothetical protein